MPENYIAKETFAKPVKKVIADFLAGYGVSPQLVAPVIDHTGGIKFNSAKIPWLKALLLPGMGKVNILSSKEDYAYTSVRFKAENDGPEVDYHEFDAVTLHAMEFFLEAKNSELTQHSHRVGLHTESAHGSSVGSFYTHLHVPQKLRAEAFKQTGGASSYFAVEESYMIDFPFRLREELAQGNKSILRHLPSAVIIATKVHPINRNRFGSRVTSQKVT